MEKALNGRKDAETVVRALAEKGWHISFAESCTAGLAAARLVDVPDASGVFCESYVTYAEEAKMRLVGVSEESLRAFGAVSEAVAGEMACGAAKASGSEVGVGISGIAGPGGGTEEVPVGTVCFGFWVNGERCTVTKRFGAIGRRAVREASVDFAFRTLAEKLRRGESMGACLPSP